MVIYSIKNLLKVFKDSTSIVIFTNLMSDFICQVIHEWLNIYVEKIEVKYDFFFPGKIIESVIHKSLQNFINVRY